MRQPSLCLVLCRLFLSAAQHVRMTCGPLAGEHLLGCSVALAMPYVSTGRSKAKAMKMGMETWASFEAGLRCAVFGLGPRPRPRPLPVHCSRQHWRHDSEWLNPPPALAAAGAMLPVTAEELAISAGGRHSCADAFSIAPCPSICGFPRL
eukprot:608509-Rhodomonas_salina.1